MGAVARLTVGRVMDYVEVALDTMLRENKRPRRYVGHAEDFRVEAYWTDENVLTIEVHVEP